MNHDTTMPETKPLSAELSHYLNGEQNNTMGLFSSAESFTAAMQMASAISRSDMIPKEYQGNVPNTIIALDVAMRVGMSPFAVMQNLYIVNGRPSWSSQFIIAVMNKSRRYQGPIQFHVEGTGDRLSCYAWAVDQEGQVLKGATITIEMAKAEGWVSKSGSKWKTMPEQMIRYRAAAFFGRTYCPDLIMGVYTAEEVREREPERMSSPYETLDPFSKKDAPEPIREPVEEERKKPYPITPAKEYKSHAQEEVETNFLGE